MSLDPIYDRLFRSLDWFGSVARLNRRLRRQANRRSRIERKAALKRAVRLDMGYGRLFS